MAKTPKQIIHDAVEILKVRGKWTKGTLRNGQGQVCAVGALREAAGNELESNGNYFRPLYKEPQGMRKNFLKAQDLVNTALNELHPLSAASCIEDYNDDDHRRKGQIIEVLEKAEELAS